jgi:glycosyltransferase involved in cell wall biosynthesis
LIDEIDLLKKKIKDNINVLINDNKLEEAYSLINEYMKNIDGDAEIYSIKSVILIMQGSIEEAESVIKEGLAYDSENFDLDYNLAYIYEKRNNFVEAFKLYEKSLDKCNDNNLRKELIEIIEKIKENQEVEDYLKNLPLVSVCIPVYNGEKYIKYTIESVLNQTYKNIEIIISDNCSTDNTIKIVESYDDKRIKLYKNEQNFGMLLNHINCLKFSSGKYLKLLYCDDIIHDNCIEEMVTVMEKNPDVNLCSVNFSHIDRDNNIISKPILNIKDGKYESINIYKGLLINGNIIGCPSGTIIRKSSFNKNTFSEKRRYMGDYDLWIRICKDSNYYFLDKPYMFFRVHNDSMTNNKISSIERVIDFYDILNTYIDNNIFNEMEIQDAYLNANYRCYYSLKINDNKKEKIEIINYIIEKSKCLPDNEKRELLEFKDRLEKI